MSEVKKPAVKKAPAKPAAKKEVAPKVEKVEKPAPVKVAKPKPEPKVVEQGDRNMRKTRTGKVVSNKMDKTIVVLITEKKPHPLYKKTVTRSKKFKAHDESNECGIGDTVEIMETRPLSKDKHFRLVKIIEKAK